MNVFLNNNKKKQLYNVILDENICISVTVLFIKYNGFIRVMIIIKSCKYLYNF